MVGQRVGAGLAPLAARQGAPGDDRLVAAAKTSKLTITPWLTRIAMPQSASCPVLRDSCIQQVSSWP